MFSKLNASFKRPNLENLLEESYHNKLKQYDLMNEFLKSQIYVRGMKKGKELFLNYEEDSLLAFTSEKPLRNARQPIEDYVYCEVKLILNVIPAGIRILLNTGPNYGKEFLPSELAFLKEGKIPPDLTQTYELQGGQKFVIYTPKIYPTKLIDSLFNKMKECPNIEKAFIAEILMLDNTQPNLIVGIKVSNPSGFQQVIVSVAEAAKGVIGQNKYVDFIEVKDNDNSAISKFMLNESKPFFDKEFLS